MNNQKDHVKKLYSRRYAHIYDWLMMPLKSFTKPVYKHLNKRIKQLTNEQQVILDVGCGTGDLLDRLKTHGTFSRYIGIDQSEGMLQEARSKFSNRSNIIFKQEDILQFTPPNTFDLIFCNWVLSHNIEQYRQIVKKCQSLLSPNGRLLVIAFGTSKSVWTLPIQWAFSHVFHAKPITLSPNNKTHIKKFLGGLILFAEVKNS